MIWKYLEQNILCPKDLNWVQHCISRIGLYKKRKGFCFTLLTAILVDLDDDLCVKIKYVCKVCISYQWFVWSQNNVSQKERLDQKLHLCNFQRVSSR